MIIFPWHYRRDPACVALNLFCPMLLASLIYINNTTKTWNSVSCSPDHANSPYRVAKLFIQGTYFLCFDLLILSPSPKLSRNSLVKALGVLSFVFKHVAKIFGSLKTNTKSLSYSCPTNCGFLYGISMSTCLACCNSLPSYPSHRLWFNHTWPCRKEVLKQTVM